MSRATRLASPAAATAIAACLALTIACGVLAWAWLHASTHHHHALAHGHEWLTGLAGNWSNGAALIGLVALIACSLVGVGIVIGIEGLGGRAARRSADTATAPVTLRIEAAGLKLDCEAAAVLKLIHNYLEANQTFSSSLATAGRDLPGSAKSGELGQIVQRLIVENRKMQSETSDLERSLEQSRAQIETLRGDLAHAQELGLRDPLTQVGNRRSFDINLASTIDAARADGTSMCLVMGDIDHFKRINDAFGHVVGDEVLKVFASTLCSSVAEKDVVARYGGEEFAIILPETELASAKQLTEQIRDELAQKRLVASTCEEPVGKITASFGIAQLVAGDTAAKLVQRADDMLFAAKHAGRDRVAIDGLAAA